MQVSSKRDRQDSSPQIEILSECLTSIKKLDKDRNSTDFKKEVRELLTAIKSKLGDNCSEEEIPQKNHEECLKLKGNIARAIFSCEDTKLAENWLKNHPGYLKMLKLLSAKASDDVDDIFRDETSFFLVLEHTPSLSTVL